MPIELIIRIIEETLSRFGEAAQYDDYRAVAFELYPAEMEAQTNSFARTGFVKWLKTIASVVTRLGGNLPQTTRDSSGDHPSAHA